MANQYAADAFDQTPTQRKKKLETSIGVDVNQGSSLPNLDPGKTSHAAAMPDIGGQPIPPEMMGQLGYGGVQGSPLLGMPAGGSTVSRLQGMAEEGQKTWNPYQSIIDANRQQPQHPDNQPTPTPTPTPDPGPSKDDQIRDDLSQIHLDRLSGKATDPLSGAYAARVAEQAQAQRRAAGDQLAGRGFTDPSKLGLNYAFDIDRQVAGLMESRAAEWRNQVSTEAQSYLAGQDQTRLSQGQLALQRELGVRGLDLQDKGLGIQSDYANRALEQQRQQYQASLDQQNRQNNVSIGMQLFDRVANKFGFTKSADGKTATIPPPQIPGMPNLTGVFGGDSDWGSNEEETAGGWGG